MFRVDENRAQAWMRATALALTERTGEEHHILVEVSSERSAEVLAVLPTRSGLPDVRRTTTGPASIVATLYRGLECAQSGLTLLEQEQNRSMGARPTVLYCTELHQTALVVMVLTCAYCRVAGQGHFAHRTGSVGVKIRMPGTFDS